MQNERMDNTKTSATNESKDLCYTDEIENSASNDKQTNSLENVSQSSSDVMSNEKKSIHDEKVATPKKSSETAVLQSPKANTPTNLKTEEVELTNNKSQSQDEESAQNGRNGESSNSNKSENNEESEDNTEIKGEITTTSKMAQDTAELHAEETKISKTENEAQQEMSTYSIAPPKPPRLNPVTVDDNKNEKDSSSENNNHETEKKKNEEETKTSNGQTSIPKINEEPKSADSKSDVEKNAETTENSIEKVKEREVEHVEKSDESKMDGIQDDADVVQSPAPRTG